VFDPFQFIQDYHTVSREEEQNAVNDCSCQDVELFGIVGTSPHRLVLRFLTGKRGIVQEQLRVAIRGRHQMSKATTSKRGVLTWEAATDET
jgi:hypothetical protein